MKTKDVDALVSMVRELARALEDPWAIGRLHWVMLSLIELAREGKAYKALDVAFETNAYLCIMAEKAQKELKAAQTGTRIGIVGEKNVWWKAGEVNIRTTQPSVTGYVQVRPEAPKPVATVEQMRAAADAAMAADQELVEWTCDTCHKKTLTDPDAEQVLPIGWSTSTNLNTGEAVYTCNECQIFGPKHGSDAPQKYVCGWCNSTTESMVFPPPGWKATDDNEVICFACAEEEAKP